MQPKFHIPGTIFILWEEGAKQTGHDFKERSVFTCTSIHTAEQINGIKEINNLT